MEIGRKGEKNTTELVNNAVVEMRRRSRKRGKRRRKRRKRRGHHPGLDFKLKTRDEEARADLPQQISVAGNSSRERTNTIQKE